MKKLFILFLMLICCLSAYSQKNENEKIKIKKEKFIPKKDSIIWDSRKMTYIPYYCDKDTLFVPEYYIMFLSKEDGKLEFKTIPRKNIGKCKE